MSDIVEQLRSMARAEHDDLSIGDEAADEIERLRLAIQAAKQAIADSNEDDAYRILKHALTPTGESNESSG